MCYAIQYPNVWLNIVADAVQYYILFFSNAVTWKLAFTTNIFEIHGAYIYVYQGQRDDINSFCILGGAFRTLY